MRLHKILDRPSFQIHIRLLQSYQNILGQSSRLTSCRVQGMGESKPADRCLNRAARRICFPPLGASPLSPQNRCRFYRLADLGHFSTPHILTIPKHAMRYTPYRGLAQVSNWVRLKFAAMNLKKKVKRYPSLSLLCIFLIFYSLIFQNAHFGSRLMGVFRQTETVATRAAV